MKKYIKIEEIKLTLNEEESWLLDKIIRILGVKKDEILDYKIVKKAIDSRNKRERFFLFILSMLVYWNKKSILKI